VPLVKHFLLVVSLASLIPLAGCGGDDDSISDINDLRGCFTEAGAKIASKPSDMQFALADAKADPLEEEAGLENDTLGITFIGYNTMAVKPSCDGRDQYRVYVAFKDDTPALSEPILHPERQAFVAYLPPPAESDAIAKVDDCLDGSLGDG
jgi:hypothetical protein